MVSSSGRTGRATTAPAWSGWHRASAHNSKLLLQHANEQEQSSAATGSGGGGPCPSILDRLKDLGSRAQNWLEEG
ncbi:UNVERIFIED_ORG: hypothetical protein ABIB13_001419 [Arthrobacter sp. UYEF2]